MGNFAGTAPPWGRAPFRSVGYRIEPSEKWCPIWWYDVIEEVYETDGTYVPVRTTSKLAIRVPLSVAKIIIKTQES